MFEQLIYVLEAVGIVTFAVSGMMAARVKNMDPVGIYTVSCVTAFGGGTLRDLILDRTPVYWIQHQEFPITILALALLFSYVSQWRRLRESHIVLPDAVGLGIFTILGARLSLNAGMSPFIASMLGVMTGTFGGAIRDIICNEVPIIFRKENLYASCAFLGCWFYFGSMAILKGEVAPVAAGFGFIVAARLLAVKWNIRLQKDNYS